ncbi:MAG: NifU family protein [Planctomycetes bacterium]|jgi:Fe-S cluster biogenesis protein NfuA|nr:NifU family protein [Planctomycetota bacterium]MCP4838462.1 NifU family protein [Planctomycetota bacterium]
MVDSSSQPDSVQSRVLAVLDAVRPAIQADGGDIELVEITDSGEVRIRMLGACIECPSAHLTLRLGIEKNLVERVPEITAVTAVA